MRNLLIALLKKLKKQFFKMFNHFTKYDWFKGLFKDIDDFWEKVELYNLGIKDEGKFDKFKDKWKNNLDWELQKENAKAKYEIFKENMKYETQKERLIEKYNETIFNIKGFFGLNKITDLKMLGEKHIQKKIKRLKNDPFNKRLFDKTMDDLLELTGDIGKTKKDLEGYHRLSSLALFAGTGQKTSRNYKLTLWFKNKNGSKNNKAYVYYGVPTWIWYMMIETRGYGGTGAYSIFLKGYLKNG
jgi:hypothetical protein